jgi:hypothetical protein
VTGLLITAVFTIVSALTALGAVYVGQNWHLLSKR